MANEKRLIEANDLWQKTFVCDEVAEVRKFIENAPTVDAVEVVRCKDCKLALEQPFMTGSTKLVCIKGINWRAVEPNHFCSYGERKD